MGRNANGRAGGDALFHEEAFAPHRSLDGWMPQNSLRRLFSGTRDLYSLKIWPDQLGNLVGSHEMDLVWEELGRKVKGKWELPAFRIPMQRIMRRSRNNLLRQRCCQQTERDSSGRGTRRKMDGRIRILKKSQPAMILGNPMPLTESFKRNTDGKITILKKSDPDGRICTAGKQGQTGNALSNGAPNINSPQLALNHYPIV